MAITNPSPTPPTVNNAVLSYLKLRQTIGFMGILLPIVLFFIPLIFTPCKEMQPSISHYYYTSLHIVFVGMLCVLGAFLITYRGVEKYENPLSNLAGICCWGVATFPTPFDTDFKEGCGCQLVSLLHKMPPAVGYTHFISATMMLLCFAAISFFIFPKHDNKAIDPIDPKKTLRNRIYRTCATIIIISILIIAYFDFVLKHQQEGTWLDYTTFIFETTSLWAFGLSWLIKGTYLLPNSSNRWIRALVSFVR